VQYIVWRTDGAAVGDDMTLISQNLVHCPFCLERGFDLKLDRRGRPYAMCRFCATRAFIRERSALIGLSRLQSSIVVLEAVPARSDELELSFDEMLDSIKRQRR
jgi:hypothetical protein